MRGHVQVHPIQLGADCCYLLVGRSSCGPRAVLVDAGQPLPRWLAKRALRKTGVPIRSIELIVITHAHWDHFGCAAALRELTGARVAVHAAERERVEQGQKVMPAAVSPWGRSFGAVLKAALPLVPLQACPVDVVVEDELSLKDYGIAGVVVHTPGHSPGSLSVVLDSGQAFVGDLAMHGLPLTLAPGLPIFAEQPDLMRPSWQRLLDEHQVKRIYPAHGKPFSADQMRVLLS